MCAFFTKQYNSFYLASRRLAKALLGAAIMSVVSPSLFAAGVFNQPELPNMGQSYSQQLSPHQEMELGRAVMREIRQRFPVINDPEINDYLQSLGNRLVNQAQLSSQTFTFFALNDRNINAFAVPGGHVGLNSALILATETESELAGVIAHEISHVTQSHFARRMEAIERMTLPRAAAFIAGLLLATVDPQLGMATLMTSSAISVDQQLYFSRMNEREADRMGVSLLYKSGFNPQGMSSFFRKLQRLSNENSRSIDFLSTHPLTQERLADMVNRLRQFPAKPVYESIDYSLMIQRLTVLLDNQPTHAVEAARKLLKEAPDHPIFRYRYALALLKNQQPEAAKREFEWLIANDTEQLTYYIGLESALFDLNKYEQAEEVFTIASRLYRSNASLIENHATCLIKAKKFKPAYELLRHYLMTHSGSPTLYKLAATAAMKTQKTAEGYRYLAEHFFELAAYPLALDNLDKALTHSQSAPIDSDSHLARKQEITRYMQQRIEPENK